jgi:membrane-bound lytic murein transglycosylase D
MQPAFLTREKIHIINMKKKILFIIIAMAFGRTCVMQAQNNNEIKVTDDKTGKEEVIELPEAMTYDLDSLLNEYNAKTYLTPDTNCNMQNVNPIFSKDIYIDRLNRIPSVIEMPYNDVVQKFIDHYSGRLRRSVSYMLGASNFYMPIFEEALDMYNVPLELKYLPVIESALNPKAISRVGASGLWQFMITTGKRYGLEVNTLIDERRDPIKASFAAAHYLSDLYKIYGDWNLVIAAYNCGPNQISKAIHRAGGIKDYWTIYPYLPKETRGYVPAFIAANYIMTYYCDHNICPMSTELPAKSDTVMVDKDLHFQQVAEICKLNIEQVRTLNPQYRTDIIPGSTQTCTICLPQTAINTFLDAKDSVYNYKVDELFTKRKEVEIPEAPEKTYQSNRHSYSRHSSTSRRNKKRKTSNKSVTVKEGQTLSDLAEKYHTSVKKLRKLNGISGSNIRAGKKFKVK